jgi:hypothetical protein
MRIPAHPTRVLPRVAVRRLLLGGLVTCLVPALSACAVVTVADAAVSVAATAVKVTATVVETTVDVAAAGVRAATREDEPASAPLP